MNAKATGGVVRGKDIDFIKLLAVSPEERKLDALLNALSHDALMELEALMWAGRGDHNGSFADNLTSAQANKDDHAVHYIAEKSPALPTYLRAGLEAIKQK
jgi:hypothetical protein